MPNLVNLQSFIGIRCKHHTQKDMYARRQASPAKHFFVKIGKLGALYFYEFGTDSGETSQI